MAKVPSVPLKKMRCWKNETAIIEQLLEIVLPLRRRFFDILVIHGYSLPG